MGLAHSAPALLDGRAAGSAQRLPAAGHGRAEEVGPYPERLAVPPEGSRLQEAVGNPSTARRQRCVRPRPCTTLPLSSCVARLLPIEETTQPRMSEAVSRRTSPCGDEGSCGVPATTRAHEPFKAPWPPICLLAQRAETPRTSCLAWLTRRGVSRSFLWLVIPEALLRQALHHASGVGRQEMRVCHRLLNVGVAEDVGNLPESCARHRQL
jgi:hypothetical protein